MTDHLPVGTHLKHPVFGEGVIIGGDAGNYRIFFENAKIKDIARTFTNIDIIEKGSAEPAGSTITLTDIEDALHNVLERFDAFQKPVPLAEKWRRGIVALQPADKSLQGKDIPIETLFHKVVMIRDRLRVLEQQINSSEKLDDQDKVNLQQYITRCYGSLTTFNVLFKNKEDYFAGESSKD